MSSQLNYNEPLPQRQGPKLHVFKDRTAKLDFVRLISDKDIEGHSHVFKVLIGAGVYALKMVS